MLWEDWASWRGQEGFALLLSQEGWGGGYSGFAILGEVQMRPIKFLDLKNMIRLKLHQKSIVAQNVTPPPPQKKKLIHSSPKTHPAKLFPPNESPPVKF